MKYLAVATVLLAACASAPPAQQPKPCNKWEYKVQYSVPTPRMERTGDGAKAATYITPNEKELTALGNEGWELVGSVLEEETAVLEVSKTAAVPNIRPQRLVLFFKRPSCLQ